MTPLLRKSVVVCAVLFCITVLAIGVRQLVGGTANQEAFVFYKVKKTDLPIVVTERGSLESQVETTITCRVENVGDRGSNGTQIIYIVPNGSAVKEGDLLVEFDSATIRDRLDQQTLAHQKAISAKKQADSLYDNQEIQNRTTLAEANLAITLAKIELEMYVHDKVGTAKLASEAIDRQVDEAKNGAMEARALLELAEVERAGMKELFKLGYRGKSDLEQSRLKYLQAEDRLASSVNQIKTHLGSQQKLDRFERLMEEERLKGALATAQRGLEQVINDNESLLEQALAAKVEAEGTEKKEKERLVHMGLQLDNSKIYAPHDGMVVYKRDRRGNSEIEAGAIVRERQDIISLPDLSKMKVTTQVHEAVLDQVRPGLPASVRIDAFPERSYRGVVDKVGVVPSSNGGWMGGGSAKTYETEVRLVDEVEQLKPGMTAVVNMHVERVEDVLTVPVQAIIQANRNTWCYVETRGGVERRDIEIGRSNDKFVHIREGISEGERVVLNSMDIYDQQNEESQEISAESGALEMSESLAEVGYDAPAADEPRRRGPGAAAGGGRGPGGARGGPGNANIAARGRVPGGGETAGGRRGTGSLGIGGDNAVARDDGAGGRERANSQGGGGAARTAQSIAN